MVTNNKKIKVMSKIKKLESLEVEIKLLKGRKNKVFKKSNSEMNEAFKEFFHELPFSHVGGYDQDSLYFEVKDESGYNKEIARLNLRRANWKNDKFNEVSIGYYSTSTNSEFELNRLITIGKIAGLVKEYSKVILDTQYDIQKKYGKTLSKLNSQIWGLEKEQSEIQRSIQEDKANKRKEKAFSNKGIDFENPLNFDLKNDYRAWNVKNLRILSWVNENKKSVNIEIKVQNHQWDQKGEKYVELDPIIQRHNKIRYSNIRSLVENNNY